MLRFVFIAIILIFGSNLQAQSENCKSIMVELSAEWESTHSSQTLDRLYKFGTSSNFSHADRIHFLVLLHDISLGENKLYYDISCSTIHYNICVFEEARNEFTQYYNDRFSFNF